MTDSSSLALGAAIGAGATAAVLLLLEGRRLRPKPARSVEVEGCGRVGVTSEKSGASTFVTLDWSKLFGTLPFKVPFCSATIDPDGTIYVSGTIGLAPPPPGGGPPAIVTGGPRAEAIRVMKLIEATLKACGAGPEHITMVRQGHAASPTSVCRSSSHVCVCVLVCRLTCT